MTFRQLFICLRPRTPYLPALCIRVYSILIHTGKGRRGGELNQREGERGNSSHRWVENNNLTDSTSVSDKPCRNVLLQVKFFRWRHFALVSIYLISPCLKCLHYATIWEVQQVIHSLKTAVWSQLLVTNYKLNNEGGTTRKCWSLTFDCYCPHSSKFSSQAWTVGEFFLLY